MLLLLLATSARGGDFIVKNFRFHDGETVREIRIHYVTFGTPRAGNAVLILHGTGGSSKQFLNDHFADVLFKSGGLLDSNKYFVVLPDNIGHGDSSKPSDGLQRKFPHYDYDDMVELQHELLASLGIRHRFMVMGTSMGGMQTWMWGERWPDMMDALVPLASAPTQIAGRNRIWRKMMIDDLERGDLASAVQILMLVGSAPLQWQKTAPTRDDADRWLGDQMKTRMATANADDLLYALEASRNYDPSPQLEKIKAPLVAINSADDFINPAELAIMEKLVARVAHGRYVLIATSGQTHNHSTHTWPGRMGRRAGQVSWCGRNITVKTTIDSAGRIVIPRDIRHAIGLEPGMVVEVEARDGGISIELAATPVKIVKRGRLRVAEAVENQPTLTEAEVRAIREEIRSGR